MEIKGINMDEDDFYYSFFLFNKLFVPIKVDIIHLINIDVIVKWIF